MKTKNTIEEIRSDVKNIQTKMFSIVYETQSHTVAI
jgi:hypothetical protein